MINLLLSLIVTLFAFPLKAQSYHKTIQPIFDNRCIACHSCYNAPCQLNLQNYEGFDRGGSKELVYQGTRVDSIKPTRMGVDAETTQEWRKKGFYNLNTTPKADKNLFFKIIAMKEAQNKTLPVDNAGESHYCPENEEEFTRFSNDNLSKMMPFAFPKLEADKIATIEEWIKAGAPGPTLQEEVERLKVSAETTSQIKNWEMFLNQKSIKQKLVSRYLYEHLFLAHIYFESDKQSFFRLVRSSRACEKLKEIPTRRPNDAPGVENFNYCLKRFTGTIVSKTHLPYQFSAKKLQRVKDLFFSTPWKVKSLPNYEPAVAENPFLAFKDIPVKARYQFLLDDAEYELSTFIKGPVCNGSAAVNSIQEQFFVAFMKPDSDFMIHKKFEEQAIPTLILPGVFGSDVKVLKTPEYLSKLVEKREDYRKLRVDWTKKTKPLGYGFKDLWNGDNHNPNAVLTVFRHDDNALVKTGVHGDLSKTIFFLDYALMERLVYNLVVNFDVFGNVGHQLMTRVYMDLIRMEAEEMFLMFLPPDKRIPTRKEWYQGYFTELKLKYFFPTLGVDIPSSVFYRDQGNTKREFVERFMFDYLKPQVLGEHDEMNWKRISVPQKFKKASTLNASEKALRELASVKAGDQTPFARYFPDIAYLIIENEIYSIVHHREHANVSWIFDEEDRFEPKEDTLTIKKGIWGSYPNMLFSLEKNQVRAFVDSVKKIKTSKDYDQMVESFGVTRLNPGFWSAYDKVNSYYFKTRPVEAGFIDLTRYEMR